MTTVPPPPPEDPQSGSPRPEPSHGQFAPPSSPVPPPPAPNQTAHVAASPWGQPGQQAGHYGQQGQTGQYAQPGQYGQPGQPGQYAQPGQQGQPGHYGQPSQSGQPGPGAASPWGQQPAQYGQPAHYPQPGAPGQQGYYASQPPGFPPQSAKRGSTKRTVLVSVLGALVVIGLAVAAYFIFSTTDVEALPRDVDTETTVNAQALTVGNCLESAPGGGEIANVTVVPCADSHEAQVVAAKKFPGDTFPGDDKVIERTTAICPGSAISSDSAPDDLELFVWTPSEKSWEQGDRQGLCIASSPSEDLTESLIG